MEGKKAFILPAVGALVFGALLVLRSTAGELEPGAQAPASEASLAHRVQAVTAKDPEARLKPSALSKLQPMLEAAVRVCGAEAGDISSVKLTVDIAAAAGVGSVVEAAGPSALPPAASACVRKRLGAFEGPDLGQTGRLSTTMQFSLTSPKDDAE